MSKRRLSISIIVPCLNEEKNLKGTIESIKSALKTTGVFSEHEILIFNDGSTDKTGVVADEIKKTEKGVAVLHNPKNMGFGYNYTEGVRLASKEYIIMVPGDNEIPAQAIEKVFALAGKADLIIPYTANTQVRPASRRAISWLFVAIINALFGLRLRYYNGTCVIRSSLLKKCPLKTWGFAYMAAILVRLIKSGASYMETGVDIKPRETGKSKAFAPKNVVSVFKAVLGLFWDVRVKERRAYSSPAKRIPV
ncbi:MAG: glycosyltransferase family 2 protein [Deltaproteobacteria bacterium]|nr:glycosyltransferase family 2 protein [Deltaproteobacteria bacterium]